MHCSSACKQLFDHVSTVQLQVLYVVRRVAVLHEALDINSQVLQVYISNVRHDSLQLYISIVIDAFFG